MTDRRGPRKSVVLDYEITHVFEDIGLRTMRLNAARVAGPAHELIVLTIEDITRYQELVDKLQTADQQKDDFLAMLAHELRNPLTAISNGLEVWERNTVDAKTERRARETAKRQLKLETGLIDDLLDVSRITRGLVKINAAPVNFVEVVRHAVAALEGECDARQHALSVSMPPTVLTVEGDAMRLEQIVTNLLGNAIKYTPNGGRIEILLSANEEQVTLTVKDNGIGMAPDFLPTIFTIFVQAECSRDRKNTGLGLGLALVQRLVTLHHGTVQASSEGLGRGSQFVVNLPMLSTQSAAEPSPAPGHHASPSPKHPRRILIVDDNSDAAESTGTLLSLDGHQIDIAADGASALESAKKKSSRRYPSRHQLARHRRFRSRTKDSRDACAGGGLAYCSQRLRWRGALREGQASRL